jgi:SAM-dependent methyltransferase
MYSEMNKIGWRGWWARKRRQRTQRAHVLQLEYQENKAHNFIKANYDPRKAMALHALEVRNMLEKVQRISAEARVLEVGSGAHGLIFFFGAQHSIGVDPLAHHYVKLFPAWQRLVSTVAAYGEALPFQDSSFDIILSENVVDHAEDPAAIIAEIARVLAPAGLFYFMVNISHPVYALFSLIYGLCKALGMPYEINDFAGHTTHLSLEEARRLFKNLPLRTVWESNNISDTRAAIRKRRVRRFRAWVRGVFYFQARYEVIAIREPHP